MFWVTFSSAFTAIWLLVYFLPWRPWGTGEYLESDWPTGKPAPAKNRSDFDAVTVIIPARNEAAVLKQTLAAVIGQGDNVRVVLVNDRSTDDTPRIAGQFDSGKLLAVSGQPLPTGWTGKLWALEQGLKHVHTDLTLCLDADIVLQPGIIAALIRKMNTDNLQMVSLMARLRMISVWERFLIPAFVYFFKMLYPFHLSNSRLRNVAAAAGGCILIQTRVLREIGGFSVLRHSLIDDCTLARMVKRQGHRTWIGLTRSALSLRAYDSLAPIWNMVARTAFYQLRYSFGLLLLTTLTMIGVFWTPVAGIFFPGSMAKLISAVGLGVMSATYLPVLKYYGRSPAWALTLPVIALFYICMTWTSAIRYWTGSGAHWKGRAYR